MLDKIVQVQELTRCFSRAKALNRVNLTISPGRVYGLVGVNGAGKTTLIKHLLGLLRAQEGIVRVFGHDPACYPVEVLKRIGYLSEERDLPEWMRIHELMRYTAAFHPAWDMGLAHELLANFRLDSRKKVKELSKGMRAQVGLVAAVAHRPQLLLLDEPSSGLDAVVRRDILNAIIRTVTDDGRTVIFSSHLLDEVDQMSDHVLMMNHGELILEGGLDDIKERHQRAVVTLPSNNLALQAVEGIVSAERMGNDWVCVCRGRLEQLGERCAGMGGVVDSVRNASLQEIFLAYAGRQCPTLAEV